MFGTKLRTWMEAHIVRSKKKKDRKKGDKCFDSNCNSPRNHGSHRSPALHQVHPVDSPSKNVDGIRLHGENGRCGTVTASSATSAGTGSVNLSSPESAYSTGYSTDGTSPGTSYPPEYYINIRTGTHYFQSNANPNAVVSTGTALAAATTVSVGVGLATATGTSTSVGNDNGNNNNNDNSSGSGNNNDNSCNKVKPKNPIGSSDFLGAGLPYGRGHGRFESNVGPFASASTSTSTSTSTSATVFSSGIMAMDNELPRDVRTSMPSKINERLPDEDRRVQQRGFPQERRYHRRTESFSAESSRSNPIVPPSSEPPPLLSPTIRSPRERSRIRTNPWLSANSSGSSIAAFKSKPNQLDDTSSGSGFKLTESSGSASDVNTAGSRTGRDRRELKQESLSAGRSPINQNWRMASGMEIRPKIALTVQRRGSSTSSNGSNSSSSGSNDGSSGNENEDEKENENENENENANANANANAKENKKEKGKEKKKEKEKRNGNENGNGSSASSITRSVRSSEDDLTLNEMMGKFDESYVYEKETDILSDSDPTDCEDYVEFLSDVDAVRDAADENEPLDNDFDYIDNGSFLDLDNLDYPGRFTNTGHCTYFAITGELARRSNRMRESLMKRRNKDDATSLQRTISVKNAAKRQITRHKKQSNEKRSTEKRKKKSSQRRKSNFDGSGSNDDKDEDENEDEDDNDNDGNNDHDDDDDDDDEEDEDEDDDEEDDEDDEDDDDDETANLNRVLVERMLLKNSGFNQGSRSVGGTPICLRRKKHDVNKNLSPLRLNEKRSSGVRVVTTVDPDIVKKRSNSVSYVNGNLARRRATTTGNAYATAFASEIALIEADKEADKKYRELILEAENILVNMQKSQTNLPVLPSPSRKFHNGLANKRVELIKNTELNIELALSKSRNSQPELQSGSIKDLEHTSPKRLRFPQSCSPIRRFDERNASTPIIPVATPTFRSTSVKCSVDSPLVSRRRSPDRSPLRCSRPRRGSVYERQDFEEYDGRRGTTVATAPSSTVQTSFGGYNGVLGVPGSCNADPRCAAPSRVSRTSFLADKPRPVPAHKDFLSSVNRRESRAPRSSGTVAAKEEGVTSSSSDSEERYDVRKRPPLMTFRSVDMGPIKEGSSYCPQSEPVKRKVYAGSATYGRIQKSLGEHVTLRNSDGDTAADDTDDSRRSLKEKVARLRRERLAANPPPPPQDSHIFQQQLSQLRRQMLMQTIEGLKRSLEDQSATLKQTCLEPVMTDRLP